MTDYRQYSLIAGLVVIGWIPQHQEVLARLEPERRDPTFVWNNLAAQLPGKSIIDDRHQRVGDGLLLHLRRGKKRIKLAADRGADVRVGNERLLCSYIGCREHDGSRLGRVGDHGRVCRHGLSPHDLVIIAVTLDRRGIGDPPVVQGQSCLSDSRRWIGTQR
ncbi:MAG TPA: hypothetical protein VGF36_01505 [Rhodopila sp.]